MENWALWGSLGGLGGVLGWSWGVWRGKGAADCAERLNNFLTRFLFIRFSTGGVIKRS